MPETALLARISRNPEVMLGKPVIRGTRITVELVLELLSEGETVQEVLRGYPYLTEQDIRAALAYASASLGTDETHWIAADRESSTKSRKARPKRRN